jgi:hypothetical protein
MPFVQITWLPKVARNAKVRKEIADAVMKVHFFAGKTRRTNIFSQSPPPLYLVAHIHVSILFFSSIVVR